MNIFTQAKGYCPEQNSEYSITVNFAEVHFSQQTGYKKLSYHCEYAAAHGCTVHGSNGLDCPLFRNAQA